MKILNFGSCNIDFVYSLDHIVAPGETETTHKLQTFPGGKGLNQSVALSRAGAEVYHAGCLGSDGDMLLEVLKEAGVDVSYIKTVDAKNGHAVIQVSKEGANSIFLYPGSNEMITPALIDEVLADFAKEDILLLQNEISNCEYIVNKAYEKGMQIVFNPSPFNADIAKIDLNKITYLILNEVEAMGFSKSDKPEESLVYFERNYPSLKIMLTLGENGCVYKDSGCEVHQEAFLVEAVDTTAAGDTFTGYFVSGISVGADIAQVLKIASAASAIAVSRDGAAPSIPERDEVMSALDEFKIKRTSGEGEALKVQIEEYISKNLKTATLAGLAEKLGYSCVYTGSLVKKLEEKPFSKLIQDRRCAEAAELLRKSGMTVEEIINGVGYENESFFRKIFKEKYGKNPLEFRKGR